MIVGRMQRVIGIDLGTSNSCVAIMQDGVPTVIANRDGYKTTPSIVALTERKRRLVGHRAKRQAITNAEHTAHAVKRLIGRGWTSPEAKVVRDTAPFKIVEGPHADIRIMLQGDKYSVPELSAMVLAEMKSVAETFLGESVTKAVVTVPAYFNDNQRQATKDAGAIAGLEVIRIVNEPTAAALAYGLAKRGDRTIAVYDLGGGTFDISILDIGAAGVFNVIATAGDAFLGGVDFDARIVDWLLEGFTKEHSLDLRKDRLALQRINDAAERAKIELSTMNEVEVNLPFIATSPHGDPLHLRRALTRVDFARLTADLVERTVTLMEKVLEDAEMTREDIDEVLMVGGMTRVGAVERAVSAFFGRDPSKGVHADEVVALGASILGASLAGSAEGLGELLLLDVTPQTLGLMTHGGGFEGLIAQNTTVPAVSTKMFTTSRDNQTSLKLVVMQGESARADENETLGHFELDGLRPGPAGAVAVEVTFSINADGIASVSAKDVESGLEQSISVTATSGLTKGEMAKMVDAGRRYEAERSANEELEAKKQEVESLLVQMDKLFVAKVGALDAVSIEAARSAAALALDAIDRQDLAALKVQCEALASRVTRLKLLATR
jgi:molecular chaperone DnaK